MGKDGLRSKVKVLNRFTRDPVFLAEYLVRLEPEGRILVPMLGFKQQTFRAVYIAACARVNINDGLS